MSEDQFQSLKSEILDKQEELIHRNVRSTILDKQQINNEDQNINKNIKAESGNYLTIIIYGIVILGLIAGVVLGYKILKAGNVQDENQMDFFVQTISQTLLSNLEQKKFLIIDEQRKQLKSFYENKLTNLHWQKIVKYIQQQPNVIISKDNKKWILKE